MKATILKEKLKNGINIVERISGKSLSLPILNNILISVEKNLINLSATDLEIGINWWDLVKTEKEGKVAIPSKILSSFINFLPDKPIKLEVENFTLKIECENDQTLIKGVNADDFPIIPKITEGENIKIKSQLFCQGLSQVVDIAGYSSTKPEISGVYLLFQKNLITMTTTDSFRLGEKKIFLKSSLENLSQDYSLILPQRAAKEIINIFSEKEDELMISFSLNHILFETSTAENSYPKIQIVSRLIEGEYPNYKEIIPQNYETKAIFSKNDFVNQIKIASIFGGKVNEVKIKFEPKKDKIEFLSQSPDLGEHKSFINGKIEGKSCDISFNHKFLLDGLLNIKSQEIVFELNGSDRPGVLKPKGDDSYFYLVMPIKNN